MKRAESVEQVRRASARRISIAVAVVCALALVALGVALRYAVAPPPSAAPDFTLTDQNGAPFTLSSLRGRPVAIFFGYVHCTDACPVVLAHLAKAVRDPAVPRDERVVFVTVDPQRDDPRAIKRYLAAFDPSFVGVTGTLAQLEPVYAEYHIARVPSTPGAGHSLEIEHETAIFVIDRGGALRGLADGDSSVADLAHQLATSAGS